MKAFERKRLEKLAGFLETLPKQKFDFGEIAVERGLPMAEALAAGRKECGTVGCAIGWMPAAFPQAMEWSRTCSTDTLPDVKSRTTGSTDFNAACEFFGLTRTEANHLFLPLGPLLDEDSSGNNGLGYDATPKQVARHIRRFLKTKV